MCALFDDFAAVHDDDAVGGFDGGQAVGDDDAGTVFHQAFECLLDEAFGFVVQCAGGFVKKQYRCVFQNGAGDGDALPLAAGKFAAVRPDVLVQSERGAVNQVLQVGGLEGGQDFGFARVGTAVADIFKKGIVKQEYVLGDEGELGAQVIEFDVGDVGAVYAYVAGRRFDKAGQQVDDGGFAAAGTSDKGDTLSLPDVQIEVVEGFDAV